MAIRWTQCVKPLEPIRIGRDEAEQKVRVAGEIFGAGFDRHVDAMGVRREEQRRRPGVVHDDAGAMRMRGSAIAGMSCTSSVSEPGDSVNTTLVLGRMSAAMPAPIVGS